MGLLSFLKKRPLFTENVCANEKVKLENMITALRASLSGGRITILVYHFRNNRDTAIEWMERETIPYREETNVYWLDGSAAVSPEVYLVNAADLRRRAINPIPGPKIKAEAHLMEHYPLPGRDDEILSLPDTASIQFIAWSSLDEPLMKVFGGDRIAGLMKQLGLKENEIISHPFVAQSIRNAQEKIAVKTNGDSECKSSDEWFQMHISTF